MWPSAPGRPSCSAHTRTCMQPLQRGGAKLVAWSLGNFVFPAHSAGTTSTGVLLVHLGARGVVGQRLVPAKIRGVRPVPSTPSR